MSRYRYTVSYESDTSPVSTVRGEVEATDMEDANKRACFRAYSERPKRGRFRSLVVVVEAIDPGGAETPNKTGSARAVGRTEGGVS